MWNVIAIDDEGQCHRVNDSPLDAEEVGMLIDRLDGVRSVLLQPEKDHPAVKQVIRIELRSTLVDAHRVFAQLEQEGLFAKLEAVGGGSVSVKARQGFGDTHDPRCVPNDRELTALKPGGVGSESASG